MIYGKGLFKRAVRNRRTLKLVLPAKMRHLAGKYATRTPKGNVLLVKIDGSGEVKLCSVSRRCYAVVMNLGPCSKFFEEGRAYFKYDEREGVLTVWQG
jgi:hypothetical protein